jgi:hypothetical protein
VIDDLVGEAHRVENERRPARCERDELLTGAHHETSDPYLAAALKRAEQHAVPTRAVLLRAEDVGVVVVDRVDLSGLDEVLDLDDLRARPTGGGDLPSSSTT